MQRGFVLCDANLEHVLCLNPDKDGFQLEEVVDTRTLNRALCLFDVTEAKNVYTRVEEHAGDDLNLEIVNVARLYKKFF
jgi:hypothetical protein